MPQSLLGTPPLEGFLLFHGAIAIFFLIAAYTHRWLGILLLPLAAGYWWMIRRECVLAGWLGPADGPGAVGAAPPVGAGLGRAADRRSGVGFIDRRDP